MMILKFLGKVGLLILYALCIGAVAGACVVGYRFVVNLGH